MNKLIPKLDNNMSEEQAILINPLVLAFIGDSVQTLYVRTNLVHNSSMKTNELHKRVSKQINATNQSRVVMVMMEQFTEKEMDIYKRARNSKTNTSAKNATIIDYKKASGYEAVIGYLYLTGQNERLEYILEQGDIV